jgi:hypothetical protein
MRLKNTEGLHATPDLDNGWSCFIRQVKVADLVTLNDQIIANVSDKSSEFLTRLLEPYSRPSCKEEEV